MKATSHQPSANVIDFGLRELSLIRLGAILLLQEVRMELRTNTIRGPCFRRLTEHDCHSRSRSSKPEFSFGAGEAEFKTRRLAMHGLGAQQAHFRLVPDGKPTHAPRRSSNRAYERRSRKLRGLVQSYSLPRRSNVPCGSTTAIRVSCSSRCGPDGVVGT